MTAAIYVLALLCAGIALGAGAALITFAVSLSLREVIAAYRRWYRQPCVVVRLQDWRS